MTRVLVLLLVLANAAYFAWTRGALKPWGMAPAPTSEPQRAQNQIEPEAVRLLSAASTPRFGTPLTAESPAAVSAPASGPSGPQMSATRAPGECLLAGPFNDPQWALLQEALRAARWIVYMGRYADAEAVRRKRGELSVLKVATEPLRNPALEPGLSLGAHPSEAQAKAALEALGLRGVRTARVVREREEVRSHLVRVPDVEPALKPQLDSLRPMLAGKAFQPCDAPNGSVPTPQRRPS
jgi:hypothetical protein